MMSGFFAISLAIFFPGTSDTLGCVEQPFAGGIVSRPANESADCLLHIFGHMHFRRRFDDIAVFTLVRISHEFPPIRRFPLLSGTMVPRSEPRRLGKWGCLPCR